MFGQANIAEDSGFGRDPADPAGLPRGFDPDDVSRARRRSTSAIGSC